MSAAGAGRPATIDDVARAAGVSTATVSRALREHPNVAVDTRRRVVAAATRLRYVANANASRLASGRTGTIGLIAPLLTSWYTSEVTSGVEDVLAEARLDLLIGTANPAARERMFRGDARFHQRTDGVILVDVFCQEQGARRLARLDTPVVVLGEQLRAVTSVSVDNRRAARLAVEHLVGLGHRRIAVVSGHGDEDVAHNVPVERLAGARDALGDAGLDLPGDHVGDGDFTIAGGRRAMARLLDLPSPPTAVFLMSDEMAFGALHEMRHRGMRAGRDVSVIGIDDHPVADAVGLTTVRQPVRDIGRLGARLMLAALAGDTVAAHHAVEVELVVRETTAPPAV